MNTLRPRAARKDVAALLDHFRKNPGIPFTKPELLKICSFAKDGIDSVRKNLALKTGFRMVEKKRFLEEDEYECPEFPLQALEVKEPDKEQKKPRLTKEFYWLARSEEVQKYNENPIEYRKKLKRLRHLNSRKTNAQRAWLEYELSNKECPPTIQHTAMLNIPANEEGTTEFVEPLDFFGKPYPNFRSVVLPFMDAANDDYDEDMYQKAQ
ncbi:TPA: hypothetical protein QH074_004288 [Enterobacter hormaechei subsp. steigerwaltii]|nr:hypothetical protein [Enterobacter hormaechei subsp. steigerwaltii]